MGPPLHLQGGQKMDPAAQVLQQPETQPPGPTRGRSQFACLHRGRARQPQEELEEEERSTLRAEHPLRLLEPLLEEEPLLLAPQCRRWRPLLNSGWPPLRQLALVLPPKRTVAPSPTVLSMPMALAPILVVPAPLPLRFQRFPSTCLARPQKHCPARTQSQEPRPRQQLLLLRLQRSLPPPPPLLPMSRRRLPR